MPLFAFNKTIWSLSKSLRNASAAKFCFTFFLAPKFSK